MHNLSLVRALALFIAAASAGHVNGDDDLDRALRVVTSLDDLVEGVDFTYVEVGGVQYVAITGETCYTSYNLRCTDQAMPCAYLTATKVCIDCDGLSGGAWTAANGLCTTSIGSSCLVNPAGITSACGKQRRSTCGGAPGSLACTTVGTASNKDCKPKECT